ncbi:MAG: UMP kinase [Candidatus Liptonbacteria bacterium]|nr:UMP kinase [Candidatus Liptonbacteria bacterium]
MKHKFGKTIVIALGGSIMYPEAIDISFLKKFRKFILKRLRNGIRFIIVAGGGRIARIYQEAAHRVSKISDEDKDWLGIHSTRANAHLLRTIFKDIADPVVIDSHGKMKALKYPVTIASGWRPGWSTDYISIAIADRFKAGETVIAGKPAHVYDKDPHKYKNAKAIREISWSKYRRLIPKKWKPGLHSPVDPVGAALAEKKRITAIIIDGKDLKNLEKMLLGKEFKGSIIRN